MIISSYYLLSYAYTSVFVEIKLLPHKPFLFDSSSIIHDSLMPKETRDWNIVDSDCRATDGATNHQQSQKW